MDDSVLRTLGIIRKSGHLAIGEETVSVACEKEKAKAVFLACDAAENTANRAFRLTQSCKIKLTVLPYSKHQIGLALGRDICAMIAVTDSGLTSLLMRKLEELNQE